MNTLSDEPGFSGRLFDRLQDVFGNDGVFMDIEGIPAGHDYKKLLEERVEQSDVLLAIIGSRWLTATDDFGNRRLDTEDDWVRREIILGLRVMNRVIPVLVNGANHLRPEILPNALTALSDCQAIELTHKRFDSDVEKIIAEVKRRLEEAEAARTSVKRVWDRESERVCRLRRKRLGLDCLRWSP